MTEIERKLDLAKKLHEEMREANQALTLKGGQLSDLMQDIAINHFGFSKDQKEFPLPDLLSKAFGAGASR